MNYSEILVRYGELTLKGKNKKSFVKKLKANVKSVLKDIDNVEVVAEYAHMYIYLHGADATSVMDRLKTVAGIHSYSPVIQVEKTLEATNQAAIDLVKAHYTGSESFKIATKRADHNFRYDTMEMNELVGEAVFEAFSNIKVKMVEPDIRVNVEVRKEGIYLSTDTYAGLGGFPVGTGGRAVLMLSGGIDSPVAGYLAMKKGMKVDVIHFYSPPYTSPQALQKAKDLTAKLAKFGGEMTFIEVPFTEIQETIKKTVPDEYSMILNRRFMLRLADLIREQRYALAIVNGESLGQVASQTLESMYAINQVTSTPIIRPLITMDKNEIIEIAKEIDSFETSTLPYEDCCTIFAPNKPKTRPKMDQVTYYESQLDVDGLIERALSALKIDTLSLDSQSDVKEEQQFSDLL